MQTYEGQTMEHIACLNGNVDLMEDIRPRFDTRDFYGNLPIHYAIARDDLAMIKKYFVKTKHYHSALNFSNETIFHVAARHNSLASLQEILGNTVFVEQLLTRNFVGNTPLHIAAKKGSV